MHLPDWVLIRRRRILNDAAGVSQADSMHHLILVVVLALASSAISAQEHQIGNKTSDAGSITGSVLQADTGARLKNVHITVTGPIPTAQAKPEKDEEDQVHFSAASTDEKGNFAFQNLKAGTYGLSASRPGMVQKGAGRESGMTVEVKSGSAQKFTIYMLAAGVITGTILNERGEPMQNLNVTAMRNGYSFTGRRLMPAQRVTSNDKGEYRLFGLKPGSYLVLVDGSRTGEEQLETGAESDSSPGTASIYAPTYYPNAFLSDKAVPIVVKAGEEAEANISLARVAAYKVLGKVLGLSPEPHDQNEEEHSRNVFLMRKGFISPAGVAVIRKDSSFEIPAVPSGEYKLMVVDWNRQTPASYGIRDVMVESSDVKDVTINLNYIAGGQLSGFIHTDGDSKLDFSKIAVVFVAAEANGIDESQRTWEGYGGEAGYAEVKNDGSFKADLPFAATRVYAMLAARTAGLEDWFTSKILLNGKDVLDSGFNTADAQRSPIEIVISTKAGTIEGTALNSVKKPFSNAEIVAVPRDPKLRRRFDMLQRTTADQEGKFRLRGVRPGEYMVMALEDAEEQPFVEDSFLKQNADKIRTIKVEVSAQEVQLQTIKIE